MVSSSSSTIIVSSSVQIRLPSARQETPELTGTNPMRDIVEEIASSSSLSLRDLARMAGTCKAFRTACFRSASTPKELDSEVEWLTDLTYKALGRDTVETIVSWLSATPSKRREWFGVSGPGKLRIDITHNKSASDGSGPRPDRHMAESGGQFTLSSIPDLRLEPPCVLPKVPILLIGTTQDPKGIGPLVQGANRTQLWYEIRNMSSNIVSVPFIGLMVLMWKRVAESRSERFFENLVCGPDLAYPGKCPPNVEVSLVAKDWKRARDTLHMWVQRCRHSLQSQSWGKISKTKRLRPR
jgi:hypothetical protein